MTITDTPTKNVLKPRRGMGHTLSRQRRQAREKIENKRETREKREAEAAREEIKRLKERKAAAKEQAEDPIILGTKLFRNTVNDHVALMRTWGYDHPVQAIIHQKNRVEAWTDFKKIHIGWPEHQFPKWSDTKGARRLVSNIKGVMQHEMGHLRFTTPFKQIIDKGDISVMATTRSMRMDLVQRCWNMLEDQRMESLVVERSPAIGQYFGIMVTDVCLGNAYMDQSWLMLAGRTYLPKQVLRISYQMFDQFCFDQGINDGAKKWFNLVQQYCAADTEKKIAQATIAAYEFIRLCRANIPDNPHPETTYDNDVKPRNTVRPPSDVLDMFDETPPPPSKKSDERGESSGDTKSEDQDGEGEEGESSEEEGDGKGASDSQSDPTSPGQSDTGANDGTNSGTPTEQDLIDALEETRSSYQDSVLKDDDVNQVVRETREGISTASTSGLPDWNGTPPDLSADLIDKSKKVARGIEDALNTFLTEASPMWMPREERGVINPFLYRTKQVGDLDYRRRWDDHGNSGLNVHVSMLSDISGSMSGAPMVALSGAVYATALACQQVGIGSTFTLWSTQGGDYRIYRNGITPSLWSAQGGTDPLRALDDLDTHNPEGAEHHLVVIFTDGAWASNFPSLRQWDAPNRHTVLVRYGSYDGAIQKDMGAHRHISISNIDDLPKHLTDALIDILDRKE